MCVNYITYSVIVIFNIFLSLVTPTPDAFMIRQNRLKECFRFSLGKFEIICMIKFFKFAENKSALDKLWYSLYSCSKDFICWLHYVAEKRYLIKDKNL